MLIARLLLFVGFVALLTRHGKQPQKKFHTTNHARNPSNWEQPSGAFVPTHQEGWHPKEEQHRRQERRYWLTSVLLTFAVAIGAGLSAMYAYNAVKAGQDQAQAARDQTYIAENALIAANRPWIKVTGLEIVRLEIRTDSVIVTANVGVKNVGASPAPRTFIRTKLLPEGSVTDGGLQAEATCQEAVANGFPPFEALVFPNEAHAFFEASIADMRAIRNSRNDRIREGYEASLPIFGETLARAYKAEEEAVPLHASLTLIGCAVYNIPVGQFAGQTAFVYTLNHNCGKGPFGTCAFDMTKPAIYTDQNVKVGEPVGGTFAR